MSEEKKNIKDVKVEKKVNMEKTESKIEANTPQKDVERNTQLKSDPTSQKLDHKTDKNTDPLDEKISKKEIKDEKEKKSLTETENKNASKDKSVRKKLTSPQANSSLKQKKNNESKSADNKQNQQESNNRNNEQGEFVEKLVSINRVAKVVKGGRRFSFAALVVVGDGNGMVGHGKGKAKEVPEAIKKATDEAKANMVRIPLRQGRTLHHDIKGRFDSGIVYLRSAPSGTGVIAGGPMRAVFEALGIQDIVAKSVGTSNPHNMVRATFEALKSASSPKIIAMRRGLKINDITKRRKFSQIGNDNVKN